MEDAFIPDGWISASSELEFSPSYRARLNMTYGKNTIRSMNDPTSP